MSKQFGKLAREYCRVELPVRILASGAGYYLGTQDLEGPVSRESMEYYPDFESAQVAFKENTWTQREHP